ncbi:RNA-directed DNA polymerase, eukaryota [Tanacetum coccineum]
MGAQKQFSFNSKEDQTFKISKSVFVTNYSEYFTSRDLWKAVNLDRLIENLCTIWIVRLLLHANVVRYHRDPIPSVWKQNVPSQGKYAGVKVNNLNVSFASILKKGNHSYASSEDSSPALVLDDICNSDRDLSVSLMRKVKDINTLPNLYLTIEEEGFQNVKLSHLGGLWVLIDLVVSCASKEKFCKHVGLPLKVWSHNTFVKIASKWGELVDIEDYEDASFSHKRLCLRTKSDDLISEKYKVIVQGKKYWLRAKEMEAWTPDFHDKSSASSSSDDESLGKDKGQANDFKKQEYATDDDKEIEKVFETKFDYEQVPVHNLSQEEVQSEDPCNMNKHSEDEVHGNINKPTEGKVMSEDPFNIYNLLKKNKVNVRQTLEEDPKYPLGFTPVQNEVEKGVAQGVNNFDDLISSNSRNMDDSRSFKGAMSKRSANMFSKVYNGGSFLDVLEELVKVGQTMRYDMEGCLNNIEAIIGSQGDGKGTSIPTFTKLLVIPVYTPQELSEKRQLWEHLASLVNQWDGESVILGDFNEVRAAHERFGSSFSHQGARAFNKFISSSSLYEIPLGGYSFTWAHKSASKMSKLDQFLLNVDYGATLFRVFNSWLNMKGFDKVVENSWKKSNFVEANGMIYLKKKLQILKQDIKSWSKETRNSSLDAKLSIQKKLLDVDKVLDQGGYSDDTVNYRSSLLKELHDINSIEASDMLKKRKSDVDGEWLVNPSKVKHEFLNHFACRFSKPEDLYIKLDTQFPNRLSGDQVDDLERPISYDEIKRAVWECGTNKSPGPDGFTFDFFRRYWSLIDHDVVNAITHFFLPQAFGFGDKWRGWIHSCFNSATGSILVNGSPSSEFWFQKGLKQGDPLSPFLFILIMESLHISFSKILDMSLFKGITFKDSLMISHLFYADDVVFTGEWNSSNINSTVNILKCFFMATGLKINIQKSKLMGIGVHSKEVDVMSKISTWDEVNSKVYSRLSKWKLNSLSIGGRLTLLKLVISSIPLYHMSIFKVPMGVLNHLESIRRNFINGVDGSKKKMTQTFSLWSRVIKAIYGDYGALDNFNRIQSKSPWLSILREISSLKSKGIDLGALIRKKVGNGEDTLFWEEHWNGEKDLRSQFPRLYALETCKHITVASKLRHVSLASSFRHPPRGGAEESQFDLFNSCIADLVLPQMLDRWFWSLEGSSEFLVKSTRILINDFFHHIGDVLTRWVKLVPIKINIFAWKVFLDKLPTRLNLSLRGVEISSIICPICNVAAESSSHLLFTCPLARNLRCKVLRWWEIDELNYSSYEKWLLWFKSIHMSSKLKGVFEGVCYVMWWSIWHFRNRLLFDKRPPSKDTLFDDIVQRSFDWCSCRCTSAFNWVI